MREAFNMSTLRYHPNVVKLLGVQLDDHISIVTELMYGNLMQLLINGEINLNFKLLLQISIDISSAMLHLHDENLLHNDIAGRNLLAQRKGNAWTVKIGDLGMSEKLEKNQDVLITKRKDLPIRWSAPEVLSKHELSKASDVWSYGVTIWEIVELKKPYHEVLSNEDVKRGICEDSLKLAPFSNPEFSEKIRPLINACQQFEHDKRPNFGHVLQFLLDLQDPEEVEIQARPPLPANWSKIKSDDYTFV
eukprot:TRINITY_DN3992_c0_g1_i1.p1 TRINITY_DN3992_c0_g1~~TRINITY_DN3992_c0_g1_i1.p1  ORF type:complete len:274 (-),score=68.83 TRINITY_DN3992_c0_g1_i1:28-771(-)